MYQRILDLERRVGQGETGGAGVKIGALGRRLTDKRGVCLLPQQGGQIHGAGKGLAAGQDENASLLAQLGVLLQVYEQRGQALDASPIVAPQVDDQAPDPVNADEREHLCGKSFKGQLFHLTADVVLKVERA